MSDSWWNEINCHTSDEFIRFLKWIAAGNCTTWQIIDIIEKPYHFKPELKRFLEWESSFLEGEEKDDK
jgi:hypothetical protein